MLCMIFISVLAFLINAFMFASIIEIKEGHIRGSI